MTNLQLKLIRGQWWIVGDPETGPVGPYEDTVAGKAEAKDAQWGLERFIRDWDKPGFMTGDRPKKEDQ